jgi:hypothetical protein
MVNIEAGRQRAPLHLLWQIAELLGSDLTLLIPSRDEMVATSNSKEKVAGTQAGIRSGVHLRPQAC